MIRSIYYREDGTRSIDLSHDDLQAALASHKGVLWVDLPANGPNDPGIETLRSVFRFHHLAIEDCFNGRVDTPKVDDYEDYLFIVAHSVSVDGASSLGIVECDMFLGPNYVVTSRLQQIPP